MKVARTVYRGRRRSDALLLPERLRQAAANLGVMRKLALNIFRLDTSSKLSLPRKRKNSAWGPDYLFDLLDLQPVSQI